MNAIRDAFVGVEKRILNDHYRIEVLEEENAKLRSALTPFAERVSVFNRVCDNAQTVGVSLGACRAAKKALEGT